jgi:hypothetical protein
MVRQDFTILIFVKIKRSVIGSLEGIRSLHVNVRKVFFGVDVYVQTPISEFNQGHSTMKMCIHLLSTAVCTFAEVYTACAVSSLKVDKSIAGTSPRYRFIVTLEPGTRQMKFFDTKLQMYENLIFIQKNH